MDYLVYATDVIKGETVKWLVPNVELIPTVTLVLLLYLQKGEKHPLTISVLPQEENGKDKV